MIIVKIRKILEFIASVFDNKDMVHSHKSDGHISEVENLEKRKQFLIEEKKRIAQKSIDWYKIDISTQKESKDISIFRKLELTKISTLKFIKQERTKREHEKQIALENSLLVKLQIASQFILEKDIHSTENLLKQIQPLLSQTKNRELHENYKKVQVSFKRLIDEIEEQERARIQEEIQKQRQIEELKRKAIERENKEIEKRARENRQRREAEEKRRILAAEKKEMAEMAERRRLKTLCSSMKDDAQEIKNILRNEGIAYFYHFTEIKNIPSIKRHGGLFSWYYCETHNITIPVQGGDEQSKKLDMKYGLEDYVRLSFCDDHPMAYRLLQNGDRLVLLKIKIDVALFKGTLFSDINAATENHTLGGKYMDLQNIDFSATKRHYVRRTDGDFKLHQAEVLVRTFIPLDCIININNPSYIN